MVVATFRLYDSSLEEVFYTKHTVKHTNFKDIKFFKLNNS